MYKISERFGNTTIENPQTFSGNVASFLRNTFLSQSSYIIVQLVYRHEKKEKLIEEFLRERRTLQEVLLAH